jgi:hypothetical protein
MHCNFAFVFLVFNWSLIFILCYSQPTFIPTIIFCPVGCLPLDKDWPITKLTWLFFNLSNLRVSNWIVILNLIDSFSLVFLLPLWYVFFSYHTNVMKKVCSILWQRLSHLSNICNRLFLLILRDRLNRAALSLNAIGPFAKNIAFFNPELTWIFFSLMVYFRD